MILYVILLDIMFFIFYKQFSLFILCDIFNIDQFYFRMFCFFYCQIYCKFVDGWVFFFKKKKERKLCIRLSYINNNVVFELFYG